MRKHYLNHRTGEDTASSTQAMKWHRSGDLVQVNVYYNETHKTGLANVVHIPGAPQPTRNADDENREHCKRIAEDLEAYTDGNVYRCPGCGSEIRLPDNVGDKYRCPCCHTTSDINDLDQLGIYDYLADCLDIEYRIDSNRETLRSVSVMIACGGPNIYIDTASTSVSLYWWSDYAEYPISYEARDAVNEWAEEMWGCR